MGNRAGLLAKKWSFLVLVVLLCGCGARLYVEEHGNQWISRPLSELQQEMSSPESYASKIQWQEKTYPLANGYYMFVEPLSPDCFMHWDINPRDKIVGYRAVGSGCEQKRSESSVSDKLESITPHDPAHP
jgi:hypothetical protein